MMKPLQAESEADMVTKPVAVLPVERLLRRTRDERKKEEKSDLSNIDEIERFMEHFNDNQKEIESDLWVTETLDRDQLPNHFQLINHKIQNLHKLYSNSTFFLRIYDKKVCQQSLHTLNDRFQQLELKMLPKKKFGFKSRKNRIENDAKNVGDWVDTSIKCEALSLNENCGFNDRTGEDLQLAGDEIDKKDVLLSGLRHCNVDLLGSPSTLHIANIESCTVHCGPVATSVFIERAKNCRLQLACQQLRIHNTVDSEFLVHVTSRAIIEDTTNVHFGVYSFQYDDIDKHYELAGLSKDVNNWDKVDDFNWLVTDKPSPNWSTKLTDSNSHGTL